MRIRKDRWHYKVWEFTYAFNQFQTPEHTSLCTYVSRTLMYPLPILVALLVMVVVVTCGMAIVDIMAVPLGIGFVGYENIKLRRFTAVRMRGFSIPRWAVHGPLVVVLTFLGLYAAAPSVFSEVAAALWVIGCVVGVLLLVVACIVICVLCIVLLLYGVKYFFTWDGWQIVRAYVKAKKEGSAHW